MEIQFKPKNYNSVSPYFIVNGGQNFIDLLSKIFMVKELRRYNLPDGSILHAEILLEDTVIMLGDSGGNNPPNTSLIHVYVQDVDEVFDKANQAGCETLNSPGERPEDPDRRGSFKDPFGNTWSVATQKRDG